MFEAYNTTAETYNHTYAYFESDLQANLATNGRPGLMYSQQPGLFSVKRSLSINCTSPKNLMIFPALEHESMLHDDINMEEVFVPKKQ
jgi:hypothetical protein